MVQMFQNAARAYRGLTVWVLACAALLAAATSQAQANERILSDPTHLLALFGYDPVAYLADGQPRLGLPDYELRYARLVWRFANKGNMEAFAADPERFIPAYGGHGALKMSRGVAAPGHPTVWLAVGPRVFLFSDAPSRFAFLLEVDILIDQADTAWPDVRDTLSP